MIVVSLWNIPFYTEKIPKNGNSRSKLSHSFILEKMYKILENTAYFASYIWYMVRKKWKWIFKCVIYVKMAKSILKNEIADKFEIL